MRLTTKGRFAVTAMIDLALNNGSGPVTLADISARQKISLSYLEQLFGKLRRRALVSSVRGPGGGYNLAGPTDQVSVADIITAVDEPIDATQCGGKENCKDDRKCITHDLWTDLNRHIFDYLAAVKLSELVAKQQKKAGDVAVMQMHDNRASASKPKEPAAA
ncbi:MAG TPA: Fe-S cluster assembly transcriptional regulator IscR [Burkholderiales bacterium]|nr:Fe-S cluster assembly transcriptional regulator IscR [Burkholderiales bacterium]